MIIVDKELKTVTCSVCEKVFQGTDKTTGYLHLQTHKGYKPFKCKICGQTFFQTTKFLLHHDKFHSKISVNYVENHSRGQIFVHKRTAKSHTGEKPLECKECEKSFKYPFELKQHLTRRVHMGEKPYMCKECRKTFSLFNDFNQHKLTHLGKKPFKCQICLKSFAQSQNLKYHLTICPSKFNK